MFLLPSQGLIVKYVDSSFGSKGINGLFLYMELASYLAVYKILNFVITSFIANAKCNECTSFHNNWKRG